MTVTKNTTVTVEDGNLRILMGKALTSLYMTTPMCERELFVLKTPTEVDKLINMLQTAKEELNKESTHYDPNTKR